jgi:selenoprotein W-related protein
MFRPYVGQPHPIQELVLLPSSGGRFEVTADGELIYSKAATGRHASQEEIVTSVRERLKK